VRRFHVVMRKVPRIQLVIYVGGKKVDVELKSENARKPICDHVPGWS
jgi:hypothetical protein